MTIVIESPEPEPGEPGALHLRTAVVDTGMGMDASEVATLFQRFGQLNKRIARDYGGSGLGLNISRELVRLLGGTIVVESEKGVGTRMAFGVRMGGVSAQEEERWLERRRKEEREREFDGIDGVARIIPPRTGNEREAQSQAAGISDSTNPSAEAETKSSSPSRFMHVLIAEASSICFSFHQICRTEKYWAFRTM